MPELQSRVQFAASNLSTVFGDRLNLIWISDLHAQADLAPFNAQQASLLDSEGSLCLIDANVDDEGGPVHALQLEADHDPSILSHHTSYRDFDHYEKEAPPWIDRPKARRLQKTLLPVEFDRDILGKRSAKKNALFTIRIIKQYRDSYKIPVQDVAALINGRAVKIGAGLDRAKSLIAGPRGDFTVWSVVAKVARPEGEPEFYLLNQVNFPINSAKIIKRQIMYKLGVRNRMKLVRCVGADVDGIVGRAIGERSFGHLLAGRFFGPVPARRPGDFVFFADLGQTDVGDAVGFGQLGDRGFPNLFVQLQPADAFGSPSHVITSSHGKR